MARLGRSLLRCFWVSASSSDTVRNLTRTHSYLAMVTTLAASGFWATCVVVLPDEGTV
jgi:hypothetical protein